MIVSYLIYELIGIVFGAKFLSYVTSIGKVDGITFFNSGLSSYGGLIGGFLMTLVFVWQFKLPVLKFSYMYAIMLPLMYAVSKLGCFSTGCCYGIEYNYFGSVIYQNSSSAPNNVSLFPVQLVESIVNGIIFFALVINYKKIKILQGVGLILILCSFAKFTLDFFRASWAYSISVNQWISIALFVVGLVIVRYRKIKVISNNRNEVRKN